MTRAYTRVANARVLIVRGSAPRKDIHTYIHTISDDVFHYKYREGASKVFYYQCFAAHHILLLVIFFLLLLLLNTSAATTTITLFTQVWRKNNTSTYSQTRPQGNYFSNLSQTVCGE